MKTLPGNVLIAAGIAADIPDVLALVRESGVVIDPADLYVREYRTFGIDDAQELRQRASGKAIGARRVFVIATGGITTEAQNALLKTLEEPPGDALFFFIVPAPATLLATVRSRAHIVELKRKTATAFDATSFLKTAPAKRLDLLKPVLEKDADDKYDTPAILGFLTAVEGAAARIPDESAMKETLEAVYRARSYATDRGALVKGLLESVALLAPML